MDWKGRAEKGDRTRPDPRFKDDRDGKRPTEDNQDDWKQVADTLTAAAQTLKPLKMRAGYHNHQLEFIERDGFRPMPFLAAHTPKEVTLQFDVGTCVEVGFDPIAWIHENPGRIRSLHLKDWGAADRGYKVLFGEGDTPGKNC